MPSHRVLITGGAGFLGSHLCDRLLRDGHQVIALDNFFTGSRANIAHLLDHKRFELVRHDVTEPFSVPCDRLYNLACPASPVHYQFNPIKTTLTSVVGTLHALRCAREYSARVLQASTSEVYGDPDVHPQVETYRGNVNTLGPRACYDEGKRCAESLVMDHRRREGVDTRIVRIFNTYGPRMALDDGRVVSNFIAQALRGADITIYGDGSQTRSFCYVDDLIDGLVRLMEHPSEPGPVNIGNPDEFTMRELAEEVIRLVGTKSKIVFRPLPEDDPKQRLPDITKARESLGFAPKVKLRDGLERTIAEFRARIAS